MPLPGVLAVTQRIYCLKKPSKKILFLPEISRKILPMKSELCEEMRNPELACESATQRICPSGRVKYIVFIPGWLSFIFHTARNKISFEKFF